MKTSAKALALLTAIASLSATSLAGSVVKVAGKPGAWHLTVNDKEHYTTCVHGGRGINLKTIRGLYIFRKVIGFFPSIPDSNDSYHVAYDVFFKEWEPYWQKHDIDGGVAGLCYYQTIHNELMDFETKEIVSNREAKR